MTFYEENPSKDAEKVFTYEGITKTVLASDIIDNAPPSVLTKLEELKTLKERDDFHPEPSCFIHTKIVTNRLIQTGNPDLIMAGVFHDLFKVRDLNGNPTGLNPKTGNPTAPYHPEDACEFIMAAETAVRLLKPQKDFTLILCGVVSIFETAESLIKFITDMGADPIRVAQICAFHMKIKRYPEMRKAKQERMEALEIFTDLQVFARADNMLVEFVL